MNQLLLQALSHSNHSGPPVWLMRQAGRYMPQYRALREKYSFLEMVHNPELAAEVTQMPVDILGVDAAILFSDILVIPEALDMGLRFDDNIGPIIERPVQTADDVAALPKPNVAEKLHFVADAIKLLKSSLKVPLIGFCGAPFTIASYMIEGRSSRDLRKSKKWLLQDPKGFHQLLECITNLTIDYIKLQISAGIQVFQIFDSWAHVLGQAQFKEFSLAYLQKLLSVLKSKDIPSILFCRGSSVFAPQLAAIAPSAISLDWNGDLAALRKQIPGHIALQGNLDPDILCAPREVVARETRSLLNSMEKEPGYIFNLGHGVLPETPLDNVKTLVDVVKSFA